MDLSKESPLNLNWSDLAWFQHYNVQLNRDTALDYFCQIGNPFYDPSCLNEQIIRNFASAEAIDDAVGIEYKLIYQQDPILFIIQKRFREPGKPARPLQEYYIIAPGEIYQAPDAATVISHRLLTAVHHFGKAFDEASQKAAYHPTSGYYWKTNGSSEEMTTKKDASKEKILTQTQRARFDAIFPNYIERFRRMPPPAPANAAQTNAGASMAPTDASTGLTPADGNLPKKEERTPSDSQMSTNERPMVEIKKQKTQK